LLAVFESNNRLLADCEAALVLTEEESSYSCAEEGDEAAAAPLLLAFCAITSLSELAE
jgi:hypothetical protein